ncbi:HNH/ENDO VII superfamily nuclease [Alteromonadaceae bacterium 2753L.S.0a.02]|nr:HNH/ENDO VII superfamily nuclease [Alteromonadaceae bacterium 2753L.S.0a.02]
MNKIDPKPHEDCHPHHIVSGGHPDAERVRFLLSAYGRHIDYVVNGCWLPKHIDVRPNMPKRLRGAVPHANIHTDAYYTWINDEINYISVKDIKSLDEKLVTIAFKLQTNTGKKGIW